MKRHIILDNIRSAYNVGSILRTADASGCTKVYTTGITPKATNKKIIKTSLGAEKTVATEHYPDSLKAIKKMRKKNIPIYGVEITKESVDYREIEYPKELALIFGHERLGISQHLLDKCDKILAIPMRGKKKSLNVASTVGIILFESIRKK